jgi:hypothetical protein
VFIWGKAQNPNFRKIFFCHLTHKKALQLFVAGMWTILRVLLIRALFNLECFLLLDCVKAQQQGNIIQTITILSQPRWQPSAISFSDTVIFAGGYIGTIGASDRVDIYNVTKRSWTQSALSFPRAELAATFSQNLVFFGGGRSRFDDSGTFYDRVDIYNTFDGSWSTATLSQPRCCLAATSVGNLVLFGGGWKPGSSNVVDVFNVTSNTWTNATLSQTRHWLAATSVDNRYALFGGGNNGSGPSNVVDIFDSLSGMWNTTTLSQARYLLAATSLGNLAFFGGGWLEGPSSNVVDIFNSTSQTWSTSTLSQARHWLAASSIREIVAFGGGWNGSTYYSVVDMLNVTSNTWFTVNLSQPRCCLASTSSTNKIFFGGGVSSGYSDVVDIFEIPLFAPSPLIQQPFLSPTTFFPFISPTSSMNFSVPFILSTPNLPNPTSQTTQNLSGTFLSNPIIYNHEVIFLLLIEKQNKQHQPVYPTKC